MRAVVIRNIYYLYLTVVAIVAAIGFPSFGYAEAKWDVWDNCRMMPNESNDGDSFHVNHDGTEYIFRLYFVDCPESSDQVPDRVAEQAAYFGLDATETINFGHEATLFTRKTLGGSTFTVSTKWEDARGQSSLPRYFAFINVNGDDLAELLVENGYARVYGEMVDRPDGLNKDYIANKLDRLAQTAKSQKNGIWSRAHNTALASTPVGVDGGTSFGVDETTFEEIQEDDSLPPVYTPVTCSNRVPVYTVHEPFTPIGYFNAGTQVEMLRFINDSMVQIKYTSPSGKVSQVSCKYWELGIPGPATNEDDMTVQ